MTKEGKIIGVISFKGGVGKTTTVANVGATLVTKFRKRTLVVDSNLFAPNLGIHLGFLDPRITIHNVLDEKVPILQAVHIHESGLHIIPASLSRGKSDNISNLKSILAPLVEQYDLILLDSAPSWGNEVKAVVEASNELLIMCTSDLPTISTTLMTIKLAQDVGASIRGVILNRTKKKTPKIERKYLEATLENSIIADIPEDPRVHEALIKKLPVVLSCPYSLASVKFMKLTAHLIGEEYSPSIWGLLRERIIRFINRY